jgi:hypothetical protein
VGVDLEILVDNEALPKFTGPGEGDYEYETWTYVVAVPNHRYSLRFENMEEDAVVSSPRVSGSLQAAAAAACRCHQIAHRRARARAHLVYSSMLRRRTAGSRG